MYNLKTGIIKNMSNKNEKRITQELIKKAIIMIIIIMF